MKPEVNLYVYAAFPDGQVLQVGRLLSRNLHRRGNYEGFFRYAPRYLGHPLAYPLNPVHLPLREAVFPAANSETGIHLVFDDSLPDAWGRHILARKGDFAQAAYAPVHLLEAIQGSGIGRLLFTGQEHAPSVQTGSIDFTNISIAMDEAGALENSADVANAEVRHLLACGSSAGGARPKVLTALDGGLWLAKFASHKDPHPRLFVSLEEAGLTLAAKAGLEVPEFRRETAGGRDVLLIRRFDATGKNGRNALVSFRTLIGTEDHYSVSYADLARIVRQFSFRPQDDLERLYRQMIVNVVLVNTDDHLQNFAMLHTRHGWCLSPAYDIVPNIYQTEQILQVNGRHNDLSADDIAAEGMNFGLSALRSKKIMADVLEKLADWQMVFETCLVPESHTGSLRDNIARRLDTLKQ